MHLSIMKPCVLLVACQWQGLYSGPWPNELVNVNVGHNFQVLRWIFGMHMCLMEPHNMSGGKSRSMSSCKFKGHVNRQEGTSTLDLLTFFSNRDFILSIHV